MSGAAFHAHGHLRVDELQEAHGFLVATTGSALAGTVFALALLASGQSSSLTATLAGQIVMEGYLRIRLPAWARRLITRSVAVVPALSVALVYGLTAIAKLLIASQVVLGLQLPFAIVPLIRATSSRAVMRPHANGRFVTVVAVAVATIIVSLNGAHSAEMLELPLRASGVPEHVLLPPVAAAFPVLGLGMGVLDYFKRLDDLSTPAWPVRRCWRQ